MANLVRHCDSSNAPDAQEAEHEANDSLETGGITLVPMPENDMGIKHVHKWHDAKLLNIIMLCLGDNLSDKEKLWTDEIILNLSLKECRTLCKVCKYKMRGTGRMSDSMGAGVKTLSTSGTKGNMSARLLSWFYHYRQDNACGIAREYEFTSGNMNLYEDIRLLEILVDKKYHQHILPIFQKSGKATLEAADVSPMANTWKYVIAPLFNNKGMYKPEPRNADCTFMGTWDPNHMSIRRRPADVLKSRYAVLRSSFTRIHNIYKMSGSNYPANLVQFCSNLKTDLDKVVWFMLKVLWIDAGDESFAQSTLQKLSGDCAIESRDTPSNLASPRKANARRGRVDGESEFTRLGAGQPTPTELLPQHPSGMEQRTELGTSVDGANAANKSIELRNTISIRNEAEAKRDRCAEAVRTAPAKKKAKLIVRYKVAAQEHSIFARQVAELMNIAYEEEKDDASFLGEGSQSGSDDSD